MEVDYGKFVKGKAIRDGIAKIRSSKLYSYFILSNIIIYSLSMVLLVLRLFGLV